MWNRILLPAVLAVLLLSSLSARAADISKCALVADGRAKVVAIEAQRRDGRTVSLSGILLTPPGQGRFPAIVMLPGTGGLVTPHCLGDLAQQFVKWGYAALIVAGTTARDAGGSLVHELGFVDQANYARAAARLLAGRTDIEGERIAVWGFSRGGLAALTLATGEGFRAVIAAAPLCPARAAEPRTPLLVMIGTDDAILSTQACEDYAARLQGRRGFEFLLLQGAGHVYWRDPEADALSTRRMAAFLKQHL